MSKVDVVAMPDPNAGAAPEVVGNCGINDCGMPRFRVIALEAAPGVSIDMPVCETHFEGLQQAKEEAANKPPELGGVPEPVWDADSSPEEVPFASCHVCGEPVGVKDGEFKAGPSDKHLVVTWWMHIAEPGKHCHEGCRCRDREVGSHRMKTLVNV